MRPQRNEAPLNPLTFISGDPPARPSQLVNGELAQELPFITSKSATGSSKITPNRLEFEARGQ
jgi:hypothetical protein